MSGENQSGNDFPLPTRALPVPSGAIDPEGEPSNVNPNARIGLWHGAQTRGETGVEVADGYLAFSLFEIPAVPDFSSPRFPELAQLDKAQRIARVAQRQKQFLAAIHDLGPLSAVTLRYFYGKSTSGEGRTRLFLIGRHYGKTEIEAIRGIRHFREMVRRTFPSEYPLVDLQPEDLEPQIIRKVLSLEGVSSIAEILKPEQIVSAWHQRPDCNFSFYYSTKPFEPGENDMVDFCRSLTDYAQNRAVVVDICLVPAASGSAGGPLTESEQIELKEWIKTCERWGRDQRIQVPGGLYSQPSSMEIAADPHAQDARKSYTEMLERYSISQARSFLYSFRALWWEDDPPLEVASALVSFATAPGKEIYPSAIDRNHPAFQRALNAARFCYVSPAVCREEIWRHAEAPETLRRLHRMVDLKEASSFFRLPIPGRDGCPGMPLETGYKEPKKEGTKPDESRPLLIGHYIEGNRKTQNQAAVNPKDLTKHCLIVGTPGSGKTTLCFSLLKQLWEEHRVPFIVLEPAKTEYRALKNLPCFEDDMLVFTVGNENISPFRFNPLEVPAGVYVSDHISTLKTCFSGAFSMWDPLPMILEQAISEVYADKGWYESGLSGEAEDLIPPTMEDLLDKALTVAKGTSYRGETAGNIRGALEARIGSLTRGLKGRCFNTRRSVPVNVLMEKPVILELDALNDEEKALAMMFILTLVRAYAKTNAIKRRDSKQELSHVVLVEEAHNVIGRGDRYGGSDKANPKEVAIRFFTNMLAEMRALNEGIIIADQLPTAIAPEAIKTTNIKVMHRVVAEDDRKEMGAAMVFDGAQFHQAAILPAGQSFVFKEGDARSQLVSEPDFKEECKQKKHPVDPAPEDGQVHDWMKSFREQDSVRPAYLPYSGCADICRACNPRIREQSERRVVRKWPIIEKALREEGKTRSVDKVASAIDHFTRDLESSDNKVERDCPIVHFWEKIAKRLVDNVHEA
jgi:Helicase HerA, central domain